MYVLYNIYHIICIYNIIYDIMYIYIYYYITYYYIIYHIIYYIYVYISIHSKAPLSLYISPHQPRLCRDTQAVQHHVQAVSVFQEILHVLRAR